VRWGRRQYHFWVWRCKVDEVAAIYEYEYLQGKYEYDQPAHLPASTTCQTDAVHAKVTHNHDQAQFDAPVTSDAC